MLGNHWEASERELKDRCEKARKELSEALIILDRTNEQVLERQKALKEMESLTYDQK